MSRPIFLFGIDSLINKRFWRDRVYTDFDRVRQQRRKDHFEAARVNPLPRMTVLFSNGIEMGSLPVIG